MTTIAGKIAPATFVLLIASTAVTGLLVSGAQAQMPVLQTFEDLPVGTAVFNQYVGVTFQNGDASYHPVTIVAPSVATASPTHAIRSSSAIPGCEFCPTVQAFNFDVPQQLVSVSVGLDPVDSFGDGLEISMTAYDTAGATGTILAQAVTSCLGTQGPTPVTAPLQVTDSLGRIQSVFLQVVSCQDGTFPLDNSAFLLDNLRYARPLNPPPEETEPPIITFVSPTDGRTVVGSTPALTGGYIAATITEDALYSLSATVNGHPAVVASFTRTDAHDFTGGAYVTDQNGLQAGPNHVCLTAVDFDWPQNTVTSCIDFTFQIKPIPPPVQLDIQAMAWEVSQSIDTGPSALRDFELNPVPPGYLVNTSGLGAVLVRGKPTLIRIYGAASGTTDVQTAVPARATVERENCTTNCILAASIPPILGLPNTPNLYGIDVPVVGTPGANLSAEAADIDDSWTFLLPPDWTADDLKVTVIVNDGAYTNFPNLPGVPECIGCVGNNSVELHVHFAAAPEIIVHPVPIHVTGTFAGVTFNDAHPRETQIQRVFQYFNELYPGRVVRGTTIDLTPSTGDDFANKSKEDLLDLLLDRFGDGSPNEFFVGLMPDGRFASGSSGIAGGGRAAQGERAVFAFANDPIAVAHEVAHAIGFDHWACEFGVEADECSVYPIPHGGIGGFGLDVANMAVIPPGDDSAQCTPHAHDFMSYGRLCNPDTCSNDDCNTFEWVSWYDYDILFHHTTVDSYDTEDPPALLVTGNIDPLGVTAVRPLHQTAVSHPIVDTIADEVGEDIYTIQGYDGVGNTVLVHNFEPHKVTSHDTPVALRFDEPVPLIPNLGGIEVFRNAESIAFVPNVGFSTPSVSVTAPAKGTTWSGGPQTIEWTEMHPAGLPMVAMVMYSPDGGTSRVTLARDVPDTSLTIDSDQLAGSTGARIIVDVSDGFNATTATSAPFTVAPKPPSVHITSPPAGSVLHDHMPLLLEGTAADRQGTLTDAQLGWTSSRDGALGSGSRLTVMSLSPGYHTLTLSVTDTQGLTGSDSIDVISVAPGTEDTGFVPPDKTALKCEKGIAASYGKLATSIVKCHVAAARGGKPDEENCEDAALAKFQRKIGKLKTTCPVCLRQGAGGFGNGLARFLDQQDGHVFCAGSVRLGESDTGLLPPDHPTRKCESRAAKAAAKLAAAIVTCHKKTAAARFDNAAFDEDGCEQAAAMQFDRVVARLKHCPPCVALDAPRLRDAIEVQLDGANGGIYCAGGVPF